jgi:DNA-binding NtrC family response regulator
MANQTTVCILDDEPIVGDRLKPEMEDDGYEVEVFTDSGSAIQRLEDRCFDIFITDLKMEGVDGMGFLEKVKEYCPESEVIIITGYATIETARESFVRGAYDFIAKPFRIGEIRDAVKKARRRVRKNSRRAQNRREKHA